MRVQRRMRPAPVELRPRDSAPDRIVVVGGAPPLEKHECRFCGGQINSAMARYVSIANDVHWHLACQ